MFDYQIVTINKQKLIKVLTSQLQQDEPIWSPYLGEFRRAIGSDSNSFSISSETIV
jgi:hypothetical protein